MKRLGAAHSRASYGPADSPRHLAFISNLCHLRLQRKGDFLQYSGPSVTAVLVGSSIEYFDRSQRTVRNASSSAVSAWQQSQGAGSKQAKPLGMAFQFGRKVIKSVEMKQKQSSSTLHHQVIVVSRQSHGRFRKVHGFVLPCSRRWFLSSPIVSSFTSRRE